MVYAFDYDGTVDDTRLQEFAIKLRKQKNEVWIVTMRRENEYNLEKMKPTLNRLGLSKHSVIFCNEKPKIDFLEAIGADVYIDNVSTEFDEIKNHTNTIPLLWK